MINLRPILDEMILEENENGIMLYRVGGIDKMLDSRKGLFFSTNLDYFRNNDNLGKDYSPEKARRYRLLPNAKVFDPAKEFEYFDPNSWWDIRCMMSDLNRFGIEDECDFEMDEEYGVTSTDGLALAGKKLGYDATVIRGIPRDRWMHNPFDEYAVYNPAVLRRL